jgi:hypothetical protein
METLIVIVLSIVCIISSACFVLRDDSKLHLFMYWSIAMLTIPFVANLVSNDNVELFIITVFYAGILPSVKYLIGMINV